MGKYETRLKLKVVESFLAGDGGAKLLARRWSVPGGERPYLGQPLPATWSGRPAAKRGAYTADFKLQVLRHQDREQLSSRQVAPIYDIRNPNQVVVWRRVVDGGGVAALEGKRRTPLVKPGKPSSEPPDPEGAAILVLEEMASARARGARPLAEVLGYGTSADAYHVTAAPDDGRGARRAMQAALRQAGITASDIQYLSAHATSTPVGDAAELRAIQDLLGASASASISSVKGATGHLLGAAGAMAAVLGTIALQHQLVPMTLNLATPDPLAGQLDLVRDAPRPRSIQHVLLNGFGFGGVNASVVLGRVGP